MSLWESIKEHPVRFFALICVAATSLFMMVAAFRLLDVLSSPDWCGKAIQAERITPGTSFQGLTGCIDILKLQLESLAWDSHLVFGSFALCLLVLIVIVIAGGKLSVSASKTGLNANIGKDVEEAAQHVADKAQEGANEVTEGAAPSNAGLPDSVR